MPMKTLRFKGSKINCFPKDQSLSDLLYSWKFMKPCCNGGCWSTFADNKALLPSDIIDFAMLPTQRFWQETVSLLAVMWPRSHQWECTLLGKNFQLKDKNYCFIFPIAFEKITHGKFQCQTGCIMGDSKIVTWGTCCPSFPWCNATTTTRLASQNGSKITQWLATMVNHLFYFLSF